MQGLSLVHFSAQLEHCLWGESIDMSIQKTKITPVGAEVDLKSGLVQGPAVMRPPYISLLKSAAPAGLMGARTFHVLRCL